VVYRLNVCSQYLDIFYENHDHNYVLKDILASEKRSISLLKIYRVFG